MKFLKNQPYFRCAARRGMCLSFLQSVNSKSAQKSGHAPEACPMPHETQEEFPIECIREPFVQCSTSFLPERATPEHGLLRNVVRPAQDVIVKGRQYPATDFSTALSSIRTRWP